MAYGAARVLDGVSLRCMDGEAVCVAGANAAGKTTLLTIAAGLQKPDSGAVLCAAAGFVPQETALLSELTVRENLSLWYAAYKRPRRELFAKGSPEEFLGLRPFAKRKACKLSGGIKKRASIACALAGNPAQLLLDEPFTALDLQSRGEIIALLRALRDGGRGLLFTSHEPSAIAELADRVLLLRDGKIVEEAALRGSLPERTAQTVELLSRAQSRPQR